MPDARRRVASTEARWAAPKPAFSIEGLSRDGWPFGRPGALCTITEPSLPDPMLPDLHAQQVQRARNARTHKAMAFNSSLISGWYPRRCRSSCVAVLLLNDGVEAGQRRRAFLFARQMGLQGTCSIEQCLNTSSNLSRAIFTISVNRGQPRRSPKSGHKSGESQKLARAARSCLFAEGDLTVGRSTPFPCAHTPPRLAQTHLTLPASSILCAAIVSKQRETRTPRELDGQRHPRCTKDAQLNQPHATHPAVSEATVSWCACTSGDSTA